MSAWPRVAHVEGLPPRWRDKAACREASPAVADAMTDALHHDAQAAALVEAYCDRCPVLDACARFALGTSAHGLWGGRVVARGRPVRARAAA